MTEEGQQTYWLRIKQRVKKFLEGKWIPESEELKPHRPKKSKERKTCIAKSNQELNAQVTDWAQVHQKLKQSHTLSAVCLRQPHILSVASSSFISLPQISSDTNIEIPEDTRHTSIFRDLEVSILPIDPSNDNRKAPVVALVKALTAVRGASGTATLFCIRDHHRIRFYNSNTSRSKPAQTGKRSTRMDKELAAESMAPAAVVRSMMDLEGTAVVDRDWSGGRQCCFVMVDRDG